jgi:hypothetical protein
MAASGNGQGKAAATLPRRRSFFYFDIIYKLKLE